MKMKKLMERLTRFLDADTSTQQNEIKSIRKVLKELKDKERSLREKLEKNPRREDADELQIKLDVIYAQRKKGLERVQVLKSSIKETKSKKD
ncbi:MAG: hypothetical protein IBX50_06835 [Marinospirillum sp.]|uniref:hypothetical protein n=1 Tax=Marinospirillum sp. TaxID=2183934 RepID=UPI0019ED4B3A|nr:hypothetical protein [Marinospirillum sp.]MBE0506423.1 hypothetical protein [Marinospirillum sp.]